MDEELKAFIYEHIQPAVVDIEVAKRVILQQFADSPLPPLAPVNTQGLLSHAERAIFQAPGPVPPGYIRTDPSLNELKAQIAAREALLLLHTTGVLIAVDPIPYQSYDRQVQVYTDTGNHAVGPFYLPLTHPTYRLATAYRQNQGFRLAGGDLYLSSFNQAHLPSRAIRCLKESGEAFRHGLYLSATMTVGAASESLWMELGQLLCNKGAP